MGVLWQMVFGNQSMCLFIYDLGLSEGASRRLARTERLRGQKTVVLRRRVVCEHVRSLRPKSTLRSFSDQVPDAWTFKRL